MRARSKRLALGRPGDDRLDRHLAHGSQRASVGVDHDVTLGIEVTLKRGADQLDARRPFDAGDARPAGNDQPRWPTVRPWNRFAVHFEGQQHIWTESNVERQAALKTLRVVAGGDRFDRVVLDTDLLEHRAQRHPGEHRVADRLVVPLITLARRVEPTPAVAGALEPHFLGLAGKRAQAREIERQRSLDSPVDSKPPLVRRQSRWWVVGAQEEERIGDHRAAHLRQRSAEVEPIPERDQIVTFAGVRWRLQVSHG